MQNSPLHEVHQAAGAKLTDFCGWQLPVSFTSISKEHTAVRQHAGLFDISHMGQVEFSGPNVEEALNGLFTNDLTKLTDSKGQYTLMCNERGGVLDDLIIYRRSSESYFAVFNAAKLSDVLAELERQLPNRGIEVNLRSGAAGMALQGPQGADVLASVVHDFKLPERLRFSETVWQGHKLLIARTGYTGEDGFEIFCDAKISVELWQKLVAKDNCFPCGLGARDSLRLEACLPLNGNELGPDITPLEAGLGKFVKLEQAADFVGKSALVAQQTDGLKRISCALKMVGKAPPPRSHYRIFKDDREIGEVTSGIASPTLSCGIGLAFIESPVAKIDTVVDIEIRGRRFPATICKKPLYKKV